MFGIFHYERTFCFISAYIVVGIFANKYSHLHVLVCMVHNFTVFLYVRSRVYLHTDQIKKKKKRELDALPPLVTHHILQMSNINSLHWYASVVQWTCFTSLGNTWLHISSFSLSFFFAVHTEASLRWRLMVIRVVRSSTHPSSRISTLNRVRVPEIRKPF